DAGALRNHRSRIDAFDLLYRMRIAEREHADEDRFAVDLQRLDRLATAAEERNGARLESRNAHVHGDLTVGRESRFDDAYRRLDPKRPLVGETVCAHEVEEAARAVSALLDLAAVRVEDAVAKIGIGSLRRFHEQDLIAPHAEVPVGELAQLLRVEIDFLA